MKKHFSIKLCILLLVLGFFNSKSYGYATSPTLPKDGVLKGNLSGIYDEKVDYSFFIGRVTDRDDLGTTLKIKTENKNIKFFKAGDKVEFKINNKNMPMCTSSLKTVEKNFLVIFVNNLGQCWKHSNFVRRGSQIDLFSNVLARRVKQASDYRSSLLLKKSDYLKQLSKINNYLWGHEQNKVQLSAKYEKKILKIQQHKQRALDQLYEVKKDNIILQQQLTKEIKNIENKLKFFKVEPFEQLIDRWTMDQDLDLPVGNRPPKSN